MKKILLSIAMVAVVLSAGRAQAAEARDCTPNSIMWCGAYTKTEWAYKLVGGDKHNTPANLQHIYSSFGVSIDQMKQAVEGEVTKDGRVLVNGRVVATGARSTGRDYISPSVKQNGVWVRDTSVSFRSPSLAAYVYQKDGVFKWAVVKSCGNVVLAKPVLKPKPVPVTPSAPIPPIVPSTPPTLPDTGMELPIMAALGTTSIAYGLRGYLQSSRNLARALRHK